MIHIYVRRGTQREFFPLVQLAVVVYKMPACGLTKSLQLKIKGNNIYLNECISVIFNLNITSKAAAFSHFQGDVMNTCKS